MTKTQFFLENDINSSLLENVGEQMIMLSNLVFYTYLGDEYYRCSNVSEIRSLQRKHLKYCINKTVSFINEELGSNLVISKDVQTYLFDFFKDNYYDLDIPIEQRQSNILYFFSMVQPHGPIDKNAYGFIINFYHDYIQCFLEI